MYQKLDVLEKNQDTQTKSSKRKKRLKWILIIMLFILGWYIIGWLLYKMSFAKIGGNLFRILSTTVYILLSSLMFLGIKWYKSKNNKMIKWIIIIFIVLVIIVLGGSIKAGIIQNVLNLEILDPTNCSHLRCGKGRISGYSKDMGCICAVDFGPGERKPIIYLYPNTETQVNVTLGTPENLSHTYPKYNSEKGRNVIAQSNGDLEDIDTGRKLYALYREGKSDSETNFDEGFVVAGKDIIPFLEEKLAILGLNEREAEEFIIYWLPQMEGNEWNLIRFETIEEQNENMPLNIIPTPDTVIRVMMDWKAIDEPIDIPEQHLTTPERNGFTVVEWGGSPRN